MDIRPHYSVRHDKDFGAMVYTTSDGRTFIRKGGHPQIGMLGYREPSRRVTVSEFLSALEGMEYVGTHGVDCIMTQEELEKLNILSAIIDGEGLPFIRVSQAGVGAYWVGGIEEDLDEPTLPCIVLNRG